jgi:hypothetical protein
MTKEGAMVDMHNRITGKQLDQLLKLQLETLDKNPALAHVLPPLMVWGAPGLGKSTIIRKAAEEAGIGFIDVRLAQREPVDVRGLPVPDQKRKLVEWFVSGDWPREGRGILLFDELTAADRSLQVAAYEFILDRRLGELYKVPDNWYICAAGNRITDRAVAATMSSALANRFMHIELECDVDNWLSWAVKNEIHPAVTGFIRFRPQMLFNQTDENLERGWPTPRSWERVSSVMKILHDDTDLIRSAVYGLVGNRAGIEFISFCKTIQNFNVREMMVDPAIEVIIPERADVCYLLCSSVAYFVWRGKTEAESAALLDGFYRISLKLSSDFAALLMMDAVNGGKHCGGAQKLYSHPRFQEWQKKHGTAFTRAAR